MSLKKTSDIMKEAGFDTSRSNGAAEAFVKYLIKQTTGVEVQNGPALSQNETHQKFSVSEFPAMNPGPAQANQSQNRNSHGGRLFPVEAPQPVQLSFDFLETNSKTKKNVS